MKRTDSVNAIWVASRTDILESVGKIQRELRNIKEDLERMDKIHFEVIKDFEELERGQEDV